MALGWRRDDSEQSGFDRIQTTRGARMGRVLYKGQDVHAAKRASSKFNNMGMVYCRAFSSEAYMILDEGSES